MENAFFCRICLFFCPKMPFLGRNCAFDTVCSPQTSLKRRSNVARTSLKRRSNVARTSLGHFATSFPEKLGFSQILHTPAQCFVVLALLRPFSPTFLQKKTHFSVKLAVCGLNLGDVCHFPATLNRNRFFSKRICKFCAIFTEMGTKHGDFGRFLPFSAHWEKKSLRKWDQRKISDVSTVAVDAAVAHHVGLTKNGQL